MKTTVVTGLLGSGKTTFIKSRLHKTGGKTVVLVNDFGSAGIDGEVFSASGIESVELPSGCVCCTLKFDLITTIRRVIENFAPGHLVIEPSGIASPAGVIEALQSAGVLEYTVVGIVDVTEFAALYGAGMYGSFFRDQVLLSDVVLVNKIDLAEEGSICEAENLVASINARAIILRTKNAEFAPDHFPFPGAENGGGQQRSTPLLFKASAHLHFDTLSFTLGRPTSFVRFSGFFASLARGRYGSIVRAKALVNTDEGPYRFDAVFGKTDRVPFGQQAEESRLVVIGERLNRPEIEKALQES